MVSSLSWGLAGAGSGEKPVKGVKMAGAREKGFSTGGVVELVAGDGAGMGCAMVKFVPKVS